MSNTPKNHAGDDFTTEMRDEQARDKDPYGDPEEERNIGGESFTSQEQRRLALQMLDDPEGLINEAQRMGDVSRAAVNFAHGISTNRKENLKYRVYQLYDGTISEF